MPYLPITEFILTASWPTRTFQSPRLWPRCELLKEEERNIIGSHHHPKFFMAVLLPKEWQNSSFKAIFLYKVLGQLKYALFLWKIIIICKFRDKSEIAFTKAFFYGNEWIYLSFEMLLFCCIDLAFNDFTIAAFIIYIISKSIKYIFSIIFTNNLVNSSFVDQRFLF